MEGSVVGKLTDWDWWLGRTPEQQERKQQRREAGRERIENFEERQAQRTDESSAGERISNFGERMSSLGWTLTWTLTLPIFGFLFFGVAGLAVGLLLAVLFVAVRRS